MLSSDQRFQPVQSFGTGFTLVSLFRFDFR